MTTTAAVSLHHYTQGSPDAPAVLLAGALGTALPVWDGVADALARDHHVVRLDLRGHGASPVPPGPYTLSGLAADVAATASELELERFAFVGLSLGSAVGLTLALEHADRLDALVLAGAAPAFGDPGTWRERAARVDAEGTGWLVEPTRDRWFTADFQAREPDVVTDVMAMLAATSPTGYSACCRALASFDVTDRLTEVRTPTLVVVGDQDPVAPPEQARVLAEGIPGAELVTLPDAAHQVAVARPAAFARAVSEHLAHAGRG